MSAKKLDLDNRETKVPLIQRFMSNGEKDTDKAEESEIAGSKKEEPVYDISSIIPNPQSEMDKIKERHLAASEQEKNELINMIKEQVKGEIMKEMAEKAAAEVQTKVPQTDNNASLKGEEHSDYTFRNAMEDIVISEVKSIVKHEKNMCKCTHCFSDICAIALNSIKPHYVTTEVGELFDKAALLDISNLNKISVEIFKAVEIVKKNPSHS